MLLKRLHWIVMWLVTKLWWTDWWPDQPTNVWTLSKRCDGTSRKWKLMTGRRWTQHSSYMRRVKTNWGKLQSHVGLEQYQNPSYQSRLQQISRISKYLGRGSDTKTSHKNQKSVKRVTDQPAWQVMGSRASDSKAQTQMNCKERCELIGHVSNRLFRCDKAPL